MATKQKQCVITLFFGSRRVCLGVAVFLLVAAKADRLPHRLTTDRTAYNALAAVPSVSSIMTHTSRPISYKDANC